MDRPSLVRSLLFGLCVAGALLVACSERPDPARIDNPFDPLLGADDPFDVEARFEDGEVVVSWNPLHLSYGVIESYLIYHSTNLAIPFSSIGTISVGSAPSPLEFRHADYVRDSYNYYIVKASTPNGESSADLVQPASIRTAPTASLASGLETSGTKMAELELLPKTLSGQTFELSTDPTFSSFTEYTPSEVSGTVVFDLGPAPRGQLFHLYSRVRRAGVVDTTGVDSLTARLRVRMSTPLNANGFIQDSLITVDVTELEGVERMRFARSAADLQTANWELPDSSGVAAVELSLDPSEFVVQLHGEFQSDFGFSETRYLELEAQQSVGTVFFKFVDDAAAEINAAVEGDTITVFAETVTGVTLMRYSESVDFSAVPWEKFSAFWTYVPSPGLGPKTLYGQFRNVFSNVVADQATITITSATP